MCKAVRYRAGEAVTVDGELREYVTVADSGNVMHWKFCPTCGTHVLATSERQPAAPAAGVAR